MSKIKYLENYLNNSSNNYSDSFKTDILIYIDEFNINNSLLKFVDKLNSKKDIENWVDKLTARIVLKFDKESLQLSDLIYDYIEFG